MNLKSSPYGSIPMLSVRKETPMKKLLACITLCALLLSAGAILAAAMPPVPGTPGSFAGADGANFSPVGNVEIEWYPDASSRLDLSDGDLTDWKSTSLTPHTITPDHMVSWVGGQTGVSDPGMPEGWQVTVYYAADADYLYMAYDIVDDTFAYSVTGSHYDGDAIQVCLDFGNKLDDVAAENPDLVLSPKNIFYSFCCIGDGAPIFLMRQESDQDGPLTEADGVKGSARRTDTGWSAEFAMSWQRLYEDYIWKAWEDDPRVFVGTDELLSFRMGCALYYLNRVEPEGEIIWAAGTTRGIRMDDGTPCITWMHYDNGIQLYLPYSDQLSFNCEGIVCVKPTETTEVPTETATEPPVETTARPDAEEETTLPATTPVTEEESDTLPPANGCYASITAGAVLLMILWAASAHMLRKKDA